MDKNIAALIRDDAYTVGVRFYADRPPPTSTKVTSLELGSWVGISEKVYTYVTTIPGLSVEDHVIVLVNDVPKVVVVVSVDTEVNIEPNENTHYKWIVAKVDLTYHFQLKEQNKELTDVVSKAYKQNLKASFKNLLLAGIDAESQQKVLSILGDKK